MIEKGKQISLFEFIQILELFPNVEYMVSCKNFYLYEPIAHFHALYTMQDLGKYISHKDSMLPVTADELIIGPVTIFKDGALVHDYIGFSKIIKLECWDKVKRFRSRNMVYDFFMGIWYKLFK